MGGGLMQLVAYGAQDVYLTGDPQITYFKVVYRRHTNFSMECIEQTFNGTPAKGSKVSCTISRNGDLIGAMHLAIPLDAADTSGTAAHDTFAAFVSEIEVEIGGQKIDKHYGEWLDIWHDLTAGADKAKANLLLADAKNATHGKSYIPLQFWFNRNVGLALPLIALQYHEVKVNITFANPNTTDIDFAAAQLWVDYIYLDTEERKRFAQMSHEYLIDQLQFPGDEAQGTKFRLNFNHPVKELVWSGFTSDPDRTWKLMLNGHDRFAAREETYFTQLQKYYHHSVVPAHEGNVAVYSFALRPEEHQPSGTCNFSRIDNATLTCDGDATSTVKIWAVNYNVLRVVPGMGGLAYSN